MAEGPNFKLPVKNDRVVRVFVILTVAVFLVSLITQIIHYLPAGSFPFAGDRFRIFNMDEENNIPTWYSSMILFVSAILFGLIAFWKLQVKDKFRWYWVILALGFATMSMDEVASIHERLVQPIDTALKITYANHFSWLLAGVPLVIVLGIIFYRFWAQLETPFKWLFLVAGLTYLGGVLAVEFLDGMIQEVTGGDNMGYAILTNIEEFLEIIGVTLLIYTLLRYINKHIPNVALSFEQSASKKVDQG